MRPGSRRAGGGGTQGGGKPVVAPGAGPVPSTPVPHESRCGATGRRTGDRSVATVEKLDEKLLSWASILDEGTWRQALNNSRLPFILPHFVL